MSKELPPEIADLPDPDKQALANLGAQLKKGKETNGKDGVHPGNAEGYVIEHTKYKNDLRSILENMRQTDNFAILEVLAEEGFKEKIF